MGKFKIAVDFTRLDAISVGAGQYRYCVGLVQGLAKINVEAQFILLGTKPKPVDELASIFEDPGTGWSYQQIPLWRWRGAHYLDHLRYAMILRKLKADLVHCLHDAIPIASPCSVVVTKYDLMQELFPEYAYIVCSRIYRTQKWALMHKARRVICISQTTAADLHNRWGVPLDRIDVIHLGTSIENGPDSVRREDNMILAPFNLEPRKNLSTLLMAFSKLIPRFPGSKLVLFGRAAVNEEREQAFAAQVAQHGLNDHVILTGFVNDAELQSLYQRATIFVFPSLYEGFGLPVLEAMKCDACVVARNASAMAEIVGSAGVLVEVGDSDALAATLADLLQHPQLRKQYSAAAKERAALFTIERTAVQTYTTYLKTLGLLKLGAGDRE